MCFVCIVSEKHVGFKRLQSSFVLIFGERRINKQIGRNLISINGDGLGFGLLVIPLDLTAKTTIVLIKVYCWMNEWELA